MKLPPFQYLRPKTLSQAIQMLENYKGYVRVLGGGTELIPLMKLGLTKPGYILATKQLPLAGVKVNKGSVVIGSATALVDIYENSVLREKYRALVDAAEGVASQAHHFTATVGGNLLQNTRCLYYNQSDLVRKGLSKCFKGGGETCHAVKGGRRCFSVYQGDLAPALIALGAEVRLESREGTRTIPVQELFAGTGVKPLSLGDNEMLTRVILPAAKSRSCSSYMKLRMRGAIDYPLAAAAVLVSLDKTGKIDTARMSIGACGPAPLLVERAKELLEGKMPDQVKIEALGEAAHQAAEAVNNLSLPGSYRRKMIGILAMKVLRVTLAGLRQKG